VKFPANGHIEILSCTQFVGSLVRTAVFGEPFGEPSWSTAGRRPRISRVVMISTELPVHRLDAEHYGQIVASGTLHEERVWSWIDGFLVATCSTPGARAPSSA
jgi:hypothetical protein